MGNALEECGPLPPALMAPFYFDVEPSDVSTLKRSTSTPTGPSKKIKTEQWSEDEGIGPGDSWTSRHSSIGPCKPESSVHGDDKKHEPALVPRQGLAETKCLSRTARGIPRRPIPDTDEVTTARTPSKLESDTDTPAPLTDGDEHVDSLVAPVMSDTGDDSQATLQDPTLSMDDFEYFASFLEEPVVLSDDEVPTPAAEQQQEFLTIPVLPSTQEMESFASSLTDFVEFSDSDTMPVKETAKADTENMPPVADAAAPTDPEEISLNPEQQRVVDLILTGRNVFYTGPAGCGKSTVLRAFVSKLKAMGKRIHIVAPTGRSALQVGGTTTWTYAGWTPDHHARPMQELLHNVHSEFVWRRLNDTDVLVIDEISMVENLHFERLNQVMKEARSDRRKAFGGVQLVVTGDFFQLPPPKPFQNCLTCGKEMLIRLSTRQDNGKTYLCPNDHQSYRDPDKWAFRSAAWAECNFTSVHLHAIHRQSDPEFLRLLQKCRMGEPLSEHEVGLLTHEGEPLPPPSSQPVPPEKMATKLFPTVTEADSINRREFNRLPGPARMYWCRDTFLWQNKKTNRHLRKKGQRSPLSVPPRVYCRTETPAADVKLQSNMVHVATPIRGVLEALQEHRFEDVLELKEGMHVMLLANLSLPDRLCNGSQGIICGFTDGAELDMKARTAHLLRKTKIEDADNDDDDTTIDSKSPWMDSLTKDVDYIAFDAAQSDDHVLIRPSDLTRPEFQAREVSLFLTEEKEDQQQQRQALPSLQPKYGWPIVHFFQGPLQPVVITPYCSVSELGDDKPYSFLSRTQVPLAAAWAVTIHKSQGLTLDRVIVNLSRAFADGQVYVALSRATSLAGLQVEGLTDCLRRGQAGDAAVRAFLQATFGETQKGGLE